MRYSGIIKNDVAAGENICVTLFTQGCPHRCSGCHNPETWSYDGGFEFTEQTEQEIIEAISANGLQRNFAIMGGEPLCPQNYVQVAKLVRNIRLIYPDIRIYVWTGYLYEDLLKISQSDPWIDMLLDCIDILIDGPYIAAQRDITLPMRGSANQRIIDLTKK